MEENINKFNKPPVYKEQAENLFNCLDKLLRGLAKDGIGIDGFTDGWKAVNDYVHFKLDEALAPSPGSVDVEEKKVDGLGDSSGPVSGIAMQKAIEFVRTYPTGNTFDYRMGFEAGHEFAISKDSVKEVSREGDIDLWNEVIQFTGTYDGSTHTYFKMIDALKERFTITRKQH